MKKINKANLDSLEIINNGFLYCNDSLKYLSLPKATQIGNNFMVYNKVFSMIYWRNI